MKKVILLIALVFSSFAIPAQNSGFAIEVNGGVLNHESLTGQFSSIVGTQEDLQVGQASLGIEWDWFAKNKFNFGPAAKLYTHEADFMGGKDANLNHYSGSIGLMTGVDLGKFSFNTSFESPTPDKRESIFEVVISPSAAFMISDKVGIKANFDYFINKKLFNYAYAFGGGLIYKF